MNRFYFLYIVFALAFSAMSITVAAFPGPATALAASGPVTGAVDGGASAPADIVARVGDQNIRFSDINTMLNSSAIVGLSVPPFGTPERDTVRLTLLDKLISANLLYLDARKQGLDQDPGYRRAMQTFSDAILASLYRQKHVTEAVKVSDAEIRNFYDNHIVDGTEFTDQVRMEIEARLRNQKFKARMATLRDSLRQGADVVLNDKELDPSDDEVRSESDVLASLNGKDVTWGQVKDALGTLPTGSEEERREALNRYLDYKIMAQKGREQGLVDDPVYRSRVDEFGKTRLINLHRGNLIRDMEPAEEEIRQFFNANRDRITVKERRKVQMVVVKTREEAEKIKRRIEAGEITMFQAAADYSTDPNAKKTLGDFGWVVKGSGFPELDKVTFATGPDEIGGPVESPAGWHLVRILDLRDPVYTDIEDDGTHKVTRRMLIDEKLDQYVIDLRKTEFPVDVYEDVFTRLAQQEVDWYRKVSGKEQKSTKEIIEGVEKLRK